MCKFKVAQQGSEAKFLALQIKAVYSIISQTYLRHGFGSYFCEGVIIEVNVSHVFVDLERLRKGCDTRVVDTILRHGNLL